tara:strand:- start:258 stop:635 length:378 start_codon:yes stop_codon:yes gene_type:complete
MENIKIYYEDTDASGRVYYANYLKYLERGRTEFLHKLNIDHNYLKNFFNIIFVVKHCDIEFKKPAYFEDYINVKTNILKFTKVKITFLQEIYKKDELILESKITIVPVNTKGKINFIPKDILKLL